MAMNGTPRSAIAAFLEHDNEESCQAYINAVHTELCKELNKVNLNMDFLFTNLNKAYFEGVIDDKAKPEKGIYLPDGQNIPLLLGSCKRDVTKDGICERHPFISCYGGCRSFRPWRGGNHLAAKKSISKELIRFEKNEQMINFSATHVRSLNEASQGIAAVIEAIASEKADE